MTRFSNFKSLGLSSNAAYRVILYPTGKPFLFWRKIMIKKCILCQKEFKSKPCVNQKYCSQKCAKKGICEPKHRFWRKVNKNGENGCWIWTGLKMTSGYGIFGINKSCIGAHRYSWELHYGKIPDGMSVLHICDIKLCVNPKHLFIGTQADNMRDMANKNRNESVRGENNHMHKLTVNLVRAIRSMQRIRGFRKLLSIKYGLSYTTISNVINHKSWKHVV
jgi:hypothetical protein